MPGPCVPVTVIVRPSKTTLPGKANTNEAGSKNKIRPRARFLRSVKIIAFIFYVYYIDECIWLLKDDYHLFVTVKVIAWYLYES